MNSYKHFMAITVIQEAAKLSPFKSNQMNNEI